MQSRVDMPSPAAARLAVWPLAAALIVAGCTLGAPRPDGHEGAFAATGGEAGGLFEAAFTRACEPAVLGAYYVTRYRNPPGQQLTDSQRRALRPLFGDHVDRARVHWNASLITRWRVLGMNVQMSNTSAMAFGRHIFVAQAYREGDLQQLAIVAHELAHTRQAARLGSVRTFASAYCRAYYRAGFSYADHPFEVEAREVQGQVRSCLDGSC